MYMIRTATKADASALGYLHYTCWCETYAGQLDPGYLSKGSAEKSAAIFLRNGCRDMFLAEGRRFTHRLLWLQHKPG